MRGGLISRRYKTEAAERLYHSTECPPCVLTSLGLAAFHVGAYKRTSAARRLVHATSLAPGARIRFLLVMMCHAALPSPCCGTICRLFVRL